MAAMETPLRAVAALVVCLGAWSCSDSKECGSDSDCKGARICQQGACVDSGAPPEQKAGPVQQPPAQGAPGGVAPLPPGAYPVAPPPPAAPPADPNAGCVTPPPQNRNGILRSGPSLDAPEVVQVPRGYGLTILQQSGIFYEVTVPQTGHRGWMNINAVTRGPCL